MQETSHISDNDQRLVIRIGRTAIAFLTLQGQQVADYEETEMKGGISVAANLREWLKSHPQLSAAHDQADILLLSPTLLVPSDEFDAEDAAPLYKYTFTGHDRDMVAHQAIAGHHAVVVFGIDKDLHTVLSDTFATCRWQPVCLPVWRHEGKQRGKDEKNSKRLYVYLHDGQADLFSFNGSHFKFSNTFEATHAKDVLYYVLNAFTQQGMKASRDEVVVLGSMTNKQWLTQQMATYVGQVTVPDMSDPTMPLDLVFSIK